MPNPWTPGLFVPYRRTIGGIPAQVTIQEQERDELTITEHPVEQGAPINDHAFKRPSEVTIRAGWSAGWAGDLSDVSGVYGTLLMLQASLQPFELYTGKRHYKDMLIASIAVTTDQSTEFALMADIVCKQVIIVKTKTAEASTYSEDPNNQEDPQSNASQQDNGDQQPKDEGDSSPSKPSGSSAGDYGGGDEEVSDFGDNNAPGSTSNGQGPSGGGLTPTGQKVESAVALNTSPDIRSEKGISLAA